MSTQYYDSEGNLLENYNPCLYFDSGAVMSIAYCNERHQFLVSPESKNTGHFVFFSTHRDAVEHVTRVIDIMNVTSEIVMNRNEEGSGGDESPLHQEFYNIKGHRQPENDSESIFSISLCCDYSLFQVWPLKDSMEMDMEEFETWKDAVTYLEATATRMRVKA